jgi:hypothetical protein
MKSSLLILLFTLLFAMPAGAELYKWIDDDGVFHMVDDLHKVPQQDRGKLGLDLDELVEGIRAPEKSIIKSAPRTMVSPTKTVKQREPAGPSDELFGGKTLKWWVKTLGKIRHEENELIDVIASKEEYNKVYLSGRNLGTFYTQDSIDRYNRYLEELLEDQERLAKKRDYLEKLLRRAKNAGVPRNVRED